MRPIDADALKAHIDKLPALPDGNFAGTHSALKALINMQPTIDAVPVVRGKWIEHGRDRPPTCSNCGSGCLLNYESDYHKSDYCPHCGADIREEIDHD